MVNSKIKLHVYITSSLFENCQANTVLFQKNKHCLIALDAMKNGIAIEAIDYDTILAIVKDQLGDDEIINFDEVSVILEGGVYIEFENKKIISQCCGDISNVENWKTLLSATNTSFEELWIGHPTILYKYVDDKIIFSDYIEPDGSNEVKENISYNKFEFIKKLVLNIKLFEEFKIKVYDVIDKNNFKEKELIKKKLFSLV